VDRLHGRSVAEEWTNSGTVRYQEAVAGRSWRSHEVKKASFDLARTLDVMADSGLEPSEEAAGEVLLRAIAANWYGDRHPKDAEVADWLRESSMSGFGIPRGMLEDARAMKKLVRKEDGGEAEA
jgi:hypothetical protein